MAITVNLRYTGKDGNARKFADEMTAGGTVVCAQFIGKKDSESAAKSSAQLVMVTVLAMLCLTIVFELGGRALLGLIFGSVEARVMSDAVIYMSPCWCRWG